MYIDDIPAYVEAARQLGMTGIVFESAEQLKAELDGTWVAVIRQR